MALLALYRKKSSTLWPLQDSGDTFLESPVPGKNGQGVRNGYITNKDGARNDAQTIYYIGMTGRDRTSVLVLGIRRPDRPVADRNHINGQPAESVLDSYNRGARQVCAPGCRV